MKSDRGCDGGCVVDEDMYKKVMETINNQMFSQPTSDDCVSRQAVIEYIEACGAELGHDLENESVREDILNMPPVTPTRKIGKWIEVWESERDEFSGEYDEWREHKCSECNFQELDADRYKYCPNCGAEMRGSENG